MLTLLRELPRTQFRLHMVCPPELAEKIRADVPMTSNFSSSGCGPRHARVTRFDLPRSAAAKNRCAPLAYVHSSRFASPIGWMCGVPAVLETPHVAENWRHGC